MKADEIQRESAAGQVAVRRGAIPSPDPARPEPGPALSPANAHGSSSDGSDRRLGDRRDRPTRFWASLSGPRRRSGGRRGRESENSYVDRYRTSDILLLAGIFILNLADAVFTLVWLRRGGSEGNPIMQWFLEQGDWAFLAQKCLVVGLWLVILVVHKNFQIARTGLWCLLALYGAIFIYHIFLQTMAVPIPAPSPV